MPHFGVLTEPVELTEESGELRWLRNNDRHFAIGRFARTVQSAAIAVAQRFPGGAPLTVGDLSTRSGGRLMPHFSHRTGRDADLLLYVTTIGGASVPSPGFIHVGPDGLAWDAAHKRYLRLDVERQWWLVKTLLEDENSRVQWIFSSRQVSALLFEWARARGESVETLWRASEVMLQPFPGGPHDDHLHVRTACSDEDVAAGCQPSGPVRSWHAVRPQLPLPAGELATDEELVAWLAKPIEGATRGREIALSSQ